MDSDSLTTIHFNRNAIMPRKPKVKTEELLIEQDGEYVQVYLHPPSGKRKTWYAYWPKLKHRKSTGAKSLEAAKKAVLEMLGTGPKNLTANETTLSDDDFDEIQTRHFAKKQGEAARKRAASSLRSCMEAISAFRQISGLSQISLATADDCEQFQHKALQLPKNWRSKFPKSKSNVDSLSPNTVIKWSVALQAAFERANRNAEGKKCVRGVVPSEKLLTENPWKQFTWIKGHDPVIRQFDTKELTTILDFFAEKWPIVAIAPLVAKTFLWSWGRKSEVAGLQWEGVREVGSEVHFEIVGKWAVDKWFRIPRPLYEELQRVRTNNPYVFAAYTDQLRQHHLRSPRPWLAEKVATAFDPQNLGDWFYDRIRDWSQDRVDGAAYLHMFRKTTLQYARAGDDANRRVAADARLGERVMMTSYVRETDNEMRMKSNRTFERIAQALPEEVARAYDFIAPKNDPLVRKLAEAVTARDWPLVERLTGELQSRDQSKAAG